MVSGSTGKYADGQIGRSDSHEQGTFAEYCAETDAGCSLSGNNSVEFHVLRVTFNRQIVYLVSIF